MDIEKFIKDIVERQFAAKVAIALITRDMETIDKLHSFLDVIHTEMERQGMDVGKWKLAQSLAKNALEEKERQSKAHLN